MSAETHLWGSFDGYRTLKSSSGIRFDESEQLSEFGFGQTSDESVLGRFEERPCVLGRGLRSGRIAVSRAFRGLPDDAGRPTIELRTLIFDLDEFNRVRGALPSIIRDPKTWSRASFAEGRTVSVPSANVGSLTPDAWKVIDSWIELRGRQDVLFQLASGGRSEAAILAMVGGVRNSDVQGIRWGLNLLSTTAAADVCTLIPSANISTRRSVVRLDLNDGWRSQRIAQLSGSNGPPPSIASILQPPGGLIQSGDREFEGYEPQWLPLGSGNRRRPQASARPQTRSRKWLLVAGGVTCIVLLGTWLFVNGWWLEWGDRGGSAEEENNTKIASANSGKETERDDPDSGVSTPPQGPVVYGQDKGSLSPPQDQKSEDDASRGSGSGADGSDTPRRPDGDESDDIEIPELSETIHDVSPPPQQASQDSDAKGTASGAGADEDNDKEVDGGNSGSEGPSAPMIDRNDSGFVETGSPCRLAYRDLVPLTEDDFRSVKEGLKSYKAELAKTLAAWREKKEFTTTPELKREARKILDAAVEIRKNKIEPAIIPLRDECQQFGLKHPIEQCWFSAANSRSDSDLGWLTESCNRSCHDETEIVSHEDASRRFLVDRFPGESDAERSDALDRVIDNLEALRKSLAQIFEVHRLIEDMLELEKEVFDYYQNNLTEDQRRPEEFSWEEYTKRWMSPIVANGGGSKCLSEVFEEPSCPGQPSEESPLARYLLNGENGGRRNVQQVVERLHQVLKQTAEDDRKKREANRSGGMLGN